APSPSPRAPPHLPGSISTRARPLPPSEFSLRVRPLPPSPVVVASAGSPSSPSIRRSGSSLSPPFSSLFDPQRAPENPIAPSALTRSKPSPSHRRAALSSPRSFHGELPLPFSLQACESIL